VVAINKMDLVGNSQDVYNNIVIEYSEVAKSLGLKDVKYLPISAISGDNIVEKSVNFSWYEGDSLLHILENIEVQNDINLSKARFPVQYVIRPQTDALHDYRGYAGKVISGIYRVGDQVVVQPSGLKTKITGLETNGKQTNEAFAPQSVVMLLEDDIDISRGDVIVKNDDSTRIENEFQAYICWMDNKPLVPGNKYLLQLNSRRVRSIVKEIEFKLDVNTLQKNPSPAHAELNDVIKATIKTATPLPHDSYAELRQNGGAILIDETSNVTVGACMIQ